MSVSDAITKRRVRIAVGVVVVIGLVVAWTQWVQPSPRERDAAFAAACADARSLHTAGLLDEARTAYLRIAEVKPQPDCARRQSAVVADDNSAAAAAAERGAVYFGASKIKTDQPREVVLSRARNAYLEALSLDPYATGARRDLAALIASMGVPRTRDEANARCAFADRLRAARVFDAARRAYGQALVSGLTTSCAQYGLRVMRQDQAAAAYIVRRAHNLDRAGKPELARTRYIAALAWDPMAPGAHAGLDATDAPDPRDGTASGHLSDIFGFVGLRVGNLGDGATWVKDNLQAIALGVAALIVALPILMWLLYWITSTSRGKRWVGLIYLPRFARTRLRIVSFTPEDKAGTSRAQFATWLGQRLANPNAAAEDTFNDSISEPSVTDSWRAPAAPASGDIEAIFAGTPASGIVAAAFSLLHRVSPDREVRFYGELLDPSGNGPGLRVIATRRFGPQTTRTFWANELPSAPAETEAEAEAREALAIYAATWAHAEFGD